MYVSWYVFRAVNLNDPVNSREINTACAYICAEQYSVLLFHKLEINRCSFVLLHLTMELEQVSANFECFKCLVSKPDLLSWREENKNFLFLMKFEKAEQHVKFVVDVNFHIMMQKGQRCDRFKLLCIIRVCLICLLFNTIKIVDLDVLGTIQI